jgi:hypothetical protein
MVSLACQVIGNGPSRRSTLFTTLVSVSYLFYLVCLVYLVSLVYSVILVCLVSLVCLVCFVFLVCLVYLVRSQNEGLRRDMGLVQ